MRMFPVNYNYIKSGGITAVPRYTITNTEYAFAALQLTCHHLYRTFVVNMRHMIRVEQNIY